MKFHSNIYCVIDKHCQEVQNKKRKIEALRKQMLQNAAKTNATNVARFLMRVIFGHYTLKG